MMHRVNGHLVIPGRRSPVLTWDVKAQALPSWLTLDTSGVFAGASITYGGSSTDAYAQFNPAASLSSVCSLIAPTLDLTKVAFLRMALINVRFSNNTGVGASIGCWDTSSLYGGRLAVPAGTNSGNNSPYAQLITYPVGSSNPAPGDTEYVARNENEYQKPRTLTFYMYPQTRWQYAAEGDSVFASWQHVKLDKGVAIPKFYCTMPSSGTVPARWMRVDGAELEVSYL